ncbi:hypothetical protein [Streptomyces antimicrobicus]|uniref:Histidine kinase n=1 Tax=Streptomyces antimicrobicus TaxID=2883108 RepID=A0ABS8B5A1_9ACTN|nr:hypothetical protein [Streptomyces antimicrobicus]MCB5179772.1 hypothetical protein [Streptomyces antimicrobicus]
MDLTPYVDHLRHELAVAADAGGDEARTLAERLTAPLESAARLTLLNALSAASEEITRDLAPGSVDVRLRGLDPEFVVTPPPAPEATGPGVGDMARPMASSLAPSVVPPVAPSAPLAPDADEGGTARINFRLPAHLKARVEDAAGQEGLSVNAWLVRAVALALEPGGAAGTAPAGAPAAAPTRSPRTGQSYRGWVR